MRLVEVAETLDQAWLDTLTLIDSEPNGQALHVVTTVARPVADDLQSISSSPGFQEAVDEILLVRHPAWQPITTVAETIFPDSLYKWDCEAWHPDMELDQRLAVEQRATDLFTEYKDILPLISKAKKNRWGSTYFGRLVQWGEYNQVEYWISALRKLRTQGKVTFKSANLVLAGEGELALGGQLRAADDKSHLGGPCLVHIDLSVLDGQLHLLANYRHWYLQERALGNLIGLANLLRFVCYQTGYPPGEMVVVSGVANAQHDVGRSAAHELAQKLSELGWSP